MRDPTQIEDRRSSSFYGHAGADAGADPGIPKGGAQSEIYMHSYSKYIIPIGSFLESFLNLA